MRTVIMQYIYTFLGWRKGGTEVNDKKYNELLIKIGDYIQFDNEDIIFLHTLPNDKLNYLLFCNNLNASLQKELEIECYNYINTDWKPPSTYGLNNSERVIPEHYFEKDKKENQFLQIDMFYKLTKDIRNLKPLSKIQLEYVKTLPKEKILELLEIYNTCLQNINTLLERL